MRITFETFNGDKAEKNIKNMLQNKKNTFLL